MTVEAIKKVISSIYWDLKKDYKDMEEQDCFYDVGLMVAYCHAINKKKLADNIYAQFMVGK